MAETASFKYRAFLSYSHRDMAWANWLHAKLEGFRIDKDLVGRETSLGPVPETLRPIFRDREDFSGGHSLTEATVAALEASAALVVLCSTVSAGRPAVNEEVRLFRARHPQRPVIPVIIDGTPPDNFPPALRFEVAADGTVTDRPVTILGPDLRESADGRNLGLAKTIAGLTGLGPDDVYRRAERARRRQARRRTAVAAVIAVLAVGGGVAVWQSHQQQRTIEDVTLLVEKYIAVSPAQPAAPDAKDSLTRAITAIAEGAATDPRYAQALELLKAGKPDEAEPLLKAVAEDKARRADKDAKDAAAAYRNLASIVDVSDPKRARTYYAEAARLDPSDLLGMLLNGQSQQRAGELEAAQAAYARVIAMAKPGSDDHFLVWAQFGTGDIQGQRGNPGAALATYRSAQVLATRLAKSDPDNAEWQRDLAVSYTKVGDALSVQGNITEALKSYRDGIAIKSRLAMAAPGNAMWQSDLAASYHKVADAQLGRGDLVEALNASHNALTIQDRLAKAAPGNTEWQRRLGLSYQMVGDVQTLQGNLPEALKSLRDALAIQDRLAKADPDNAEWQRDLGVSYNKVGSVQLMQRNVPEALKSFRESLAIADRLAKADPGNTMRQIDLVSSLVKISEASDPRDARAALQRALSILDPLARDGKLVSLQRTWPEMIRGDLAKLPP